MIDKVSSYIKHGNTYCGIEVSSKEGDDHYYITKASKKRDEFTNLNFNERSSVSELDLQKNQHCQLVINTDKILVKKVPSDDNAITVLNNAFPGVNLDEFYYEILKTSNISYVSLCRRDEVHRIIKYLKTRNIFVLGFHLGFNSVNRLISAFPIELIYCSNCELEIENDTLIGFKKLNTSSQQYDLDGDLVASEFLLSLGSIISYEGSDSALFSNSQVALKKLNDEFNESLFFRRGLAVSLTILLLIVFTNLFFFNSYNDEYQKLQQEVELSSTYQLSFSKKAKSIREKQVLVDNLHRSGNSQTSFYINRLVQSMPNTILLSSIEYQPLERSVRPDKPILVKNNELVISGQSSDKLGYSNWIEILESKEWIENVTVVEYGTQSKENSNFSIKIKLDNETKN